MTSIVALCLGCGGKKPTNGAVAAAAGPVAAAPLPPRSVPNAVDGTGRAARFFMPEALASDGHGNLFVADTGNHTIRRVVVATGAVTTIAGSPGEKGSEDGTGAAARFRGPTGLASDGAGNLYISEGFDIRKLEVATGVVTTLAGSPDFRGSSDGTGAAASFSYPRGLAYDGAGNLYVADSGNNRMIRKVVVATGEVTTLAGSPGVATFAGSVDGKGAAAGFSSPRALAYDGHGNLFVAEDGSNVIRWIVVASGVVTTLAGSRTGNSGSANGTGSAATFYRPAGLAWDGAGNLLVADELNAEIRKVAVATGAVTTLSGLAGIQGSADGPAAIATFAHPVGLATDGAGHLFVAETMNNTVREVTLATGAVTTLAGTPGAPPRGAAAALAPPGPKPADHGAILAGVNPKAAAVIATQEALLGWPVGLASDGAGNLFLASRNDATVREVSLSTGGTRILAGSPQKTGQADGIGSEARFSEPTGVAYDGHGNLFVADGEAIRKVIISLAAVTTVARKAGSAGPRLRSPEGLAYDGAGHLYLTTGHSVRRVTVANGAVATIAGSTKAGYRDGRGPAARFNQPAGVAADGSGHLYVVDAGSGTLRRIDLASRKVTTVAGAGKPPKRRRGHPPAALGSVDGKGSNAHFVRPGGLGWDGARHLIVAERNSLRRVNVASREVTTLVTSGLESPWGIAASGGSLYVADSGKGAIFKVAPTGTVVPLSVKADAP